MFLGAHEKQKHCSSDDLAWAEEEEHSRTVPVVRWNPLRWIHQLGSRGAEQRPWCWTVHRDTGVREMERCEMHHGLQINHRLWETLRSGGLSQESVKDKKTWKHENWPQTLHNYHVPLDRMHTAWSLFQTLPIFTLQLQSFVNRGLNTSGWEFDKATKSYMIRLC